MDGYRVELNRGGSATSTTAKPIAAATRKASAAHILDDL